VTKERLLEILREVLGTEFDLGFLLKLEQEEIETLIACIRDRLNRFDNP